MGYEELQKREDSHEVGRDIEIYNKNGNLVAAIFGSSSNSIVTENQGGVPLGSPWFARAASTSAR